MSLVRLAPVGSTSTPARVDEQPGSAAQAHPPLCTTGLSLLWDFFVGLSTPFEGFSIFFSSDLLPVS